MNVFNRINAGKDYYRILGVLPTAEDVVIRGAYRALAQHYHPDRFPGTPDEATTHMAEINEAYRILSDPALRSQYDQTRASSAQSDEGVSDPHMDFEAEQFRAFAEKLHEWGYDESAIFEALAERGVRRHVAEYLARRVSGKATYG